VISDSGRKIKGLRIKKGPFFKFVWFFIFGDFNGKCRLVACEKIGKEPFENSNLK
jgi:hypothetical protein